MPAGTEMPPDIFLDLGIMGDDEDEDDPSAKSPLP